MTSIEADLIEKTVLPSDPRLNQIHMCKLCRKTEIFPGGNPDWQTHFKSKHPAVKKMYTDGA